MRGSTGHSGHSWQRSGYRQTWVVLSALRTLAEPHGGHTSPKSVTVCNPSGADSIYQV